MQKILILMGLWLQCYSLSAQATSGTIQNLINDFVKEYQKLDIPWLGYDYKEFLGAIPPIKKMEERITFVERYQARLKTLDKQTLNKDDRQQADLMRYYLDQHQQRFALEKQFKQATNHEIPQDGLFRLEHGRDWYRFMIRTANGVDISPEEVFRYGQAEVAKVQAEIMAIRKRAGYELDSAGFQQHLQNPTFFLTDRDTIVARYEQIESVVRAHLPTLFEQKPSDVPEIACMTWPNAGPFTPPAMYSSEADNAYGTAVFQFNFYGNRHNTRAMDWIFIHEAIPGHHFQRYVRRLTSIDPLSDLFFEGGMIEGWATYVEYFGEEMGLYRNDNAWLGKWEWDLVRSARLVISTGIHYYGWSKTEALAYWKTNVPGQDEIADREITRCINWPAQVLTYKIGAKTIFELREMWKKRDPEHFDVRKFHTWLLERGYLPLEVVRALMME